MSYRDPAIEARLEHIEARLTELEDATDEIDEPPARYTEGQLELISVLFVIAIAAFALSTFTALVAYSMWKPGLLIVTSTLAIVSLWGFAVTWWIKFREAGKG